MTNNKNSRKSKSRKSVNNQSSNNTAAASLTSGPIEGKSIVPQINTKQRGKNNGRSSPLRKPDAPFTPVKASRKLLKVSSQHKGRSEPIKETIEVHAVQSFGQIPQGQNQQSRYQMLNFPLQNKSVEEFQDKALTSEMQTSHGNVNQVYNEPEIHSSTIKKENSRTSHLNYITPRSINKNINQIIFDQKKVIREPQALSAYNSRAQEKIQNSQQKHQNQLSIQGANKSNSSMVNQINLNQQYIGMVNQQLPITQQYSSKSNQQIQQNGTIRLGPLRQNERIGNNDSSLKKSSNVNQRKLVPMQQQPPVNSMLSQLAGTTNQTFMQNQDSDIVYPTFTTKHNSVRINENDSSPSRNTVVDMKHQFTCFGQSASFVMKNQGTVEMNQTQVKPMTVENSGFNSKNYGHNLVQNQYAQGHVAKPLQYSNYKIRQNSTAMQSSAQRNISPSQHQNQNLLVQGMANNNQYSDEIQINMLQHPSSKKHNGGQHINHIFQQPSNQSINKLNYFNTPGPNSGSKKHNLLPMRSSQAPIQNNSQMSQFITSNQVQLKEFDNKLPLKTQQAAVKLKTQGITIHQQTPSQNIFKSTGNSNNVSGFNTGLGSSMHQITNRQQLNNGQLKQSANFKEIPLIYTPEKTPQVIHSHYLPQHIEYAKNFDQPQNQILNGQIVQTLQGQSMILSTNPRSNINNQSSLQAQPLYAYHDGHLVPVSNPNIFTGKPFISPTVVTQLHNNQLGKSLTKLNHIQHNIQQLSEEQSKLIKTILAQQGVFKNQNEPQWNENNNDYINPLNLPHYLAGVNVINDSTVKLRSLTKKQVDVYGNPIKPEKGKNKIPFENAYVQDCYKFIVMPGNNSQLIRKAVEKRNWWIEIQAVHSMYNLKWQPTSSGIKWERMQAPKSEVMASAMAGGNQNQHASTTIGEINQRQLINHVENHHLLTEKYNLLIQMQKLCEIQKENVFDFVPITFYVEMPNINKETAYNQSMQPFFQYFNVIEENKAIIAELKTKLSEIKEQELKGDGQDEVDKNGADMSGNDSEGRAENLIHSDEEIQDIPEFLLKKDKKQNHHSTGPSLGTLYKTTGSKEQQSKSTKFKQFNFEKRTNTRFSCPLSHFDGYNLWLLKPTHMNRGRGIHIFNDLSTLQKLIKEYCSGKEEENLKKKYKQEKEDSPVKDTQENQPEEMEPEEMENDPLTASPGKKSPQKSKSNYKIKHNTFIIQKYIERPLLICNRKFDIRVWVLLDQDQNIYMFKEGYIRMSGSEFGIDLENVDNAAVHLTNNAIQKQLDTYGHMYEGNIMSYPQYQNQLLKENPECDVDVYKNLVPAMKQLIIRSFYSARKTLDPQRKKYCFELFGYDFILDEDFNTWLIEINTNPCLEESNQLLKEYLPRMVEDMMKLTIDVIFPRNFKRKKSIINKSPTKVSKKLKDHIQSDKNEDKEDVIRHRPNDLNLDSIKEEQNMLTTEDDDGVNSNLAVSQSIEMARDQLFNINNNYENKEDLLQNEEDKEGEDMVEDATQKEQVRAQKALKRIYPIDGYNDNQNMFEKLINLDKQGCPHLDKKLTNNRHKYTITVHDRVFKIKKNPDYIFQKRDKKQMQEQKQKHKETVAAKGESTFSYSALKNLTLEEKVALAKQHAKEERLKKESEGQDPPTGATNQAEVQPQPTGAVELTIAPAQAVHPSESNKHLSPSM